MEMFWDRGVAGWVQDRSPFGLFTTDPGIIVTGWNYWLQSHSGRTRQEVVGKSLLDLYPDLVTRKMDQYFNEALEGRHVVLSQVFHGYLLPVKRGDEEDPDAIMAQSAIVSPLMLDGGISGTIGYIEDVSERIRREKELMEQVAQGKRLIEKLEAAAIQIKTLRGMLPICANCKKIRDDKGYWSQIESYITKHSDAVFSHGICPECAKKLYPEFSLYDDDGMMLRTSEERKTE